MRFTCGGAPQHVLRPRFTVRLAGTQLHALRWPLLALHRGARARACLCTAAPAWHECAKCGRGCTCAQLRRPRGLRGTRAPGCMRPTAPTSRAARHRGAEETAHVRCSVRACGQRGGGSTGARVPAGRRMGRVAPVGMDALEKTAVPANPTASASRVLAADRRSTCAANGSGQIANWRTPHCWTLRGGNSSFQNWRGYRFQTGVGSTSMTAKPPFKTGGAVWFQTAGGFTRMTATPKFKNGGAVRFETAGGLTR